MPEPQRFIEYDHVRGKHICRLHDEADATVETDTLDAMIDFLETWHIGLDARRPGILEVLFQRRRNDACLDTHGKRIGADRP